MLSNAGIFHIFPCLGITQQKVLGFHLVSFALWRMKGPFVADAKVMLLRESRVSRQLRVMKSRSIRSVIWFCFCGTAAATVG
jgi:hypothetical protein